MLREVGDVVLATYVWHDEMQRVHCKYRTVAVGEKPPLWNCDSEGAHEVMLIPVCVVRDPFFVSNASDIVVLCECNSPVTGYPTEANTRARAKAIFDRGRNVHPAFGIMQEYVLCDAKTQQQWNEWFEKTALPRAENSHGGVGAGCVIGREVALKHFRACTYAGLSMRELGATGLPSQWRFEMGPTEGLRAADELLLARFFLEMTCEQMGLKALYHPKPKRKCRGSACVVKYSNDQTRAEEGLTEILLIIHNLSESHADSIPHFGKDNEKRLEGDASVPSFHEFGYGIGNRAASINIPSIVFFEKRGYFEDRRPAANCDPYTVTSLIHESAVKI